MKTFNARFGVWALLLSLLGSPFAGILSAQSNDPCPSYISPLNRSHGYDPAPNSYVYFWVGCEWTVINTNSWITITTATNGAAGPGTLIYTVALNTDPQPRSGNLTIGTTNFVVNQAGGHPVLVTQPEDQNVLAGETATFKVTLNGTAPVTIQWQFNNVPLVDGDGISGVSTTNLVLTGVQTSQAGNYRVVVAGLYSSPATLTVSCNFSLSASNAGFGSSSASGSVTLNTVAASCAWSVVNTNPWVTILSSITNSGNGTVVYALAANPTTTARSGSIIIADQTFTITQSAGAISNAPISLAEALDTEGILAWNTIGTPAWFGETLVSLDGVDAAQSGPIGNSSAVTALSTITGPGTLSFWWKVSSETNKDYLKFFVNGVQQTRISGETDWQSLSYSFPSGTYTSKWTYSKNASGTAGQDRGWLDQVRFLAGPGCVVTLSQTNATHSSGSETGQVNVAAAAGCTWGVINLSSWITPVVNAGGSNGFVRYTLAANDSSTNRTGVIIIAGQPFTVVQLGVPCTYSISPFSRTHGFASATGSVSITTQPGCAWNVINTNAWITIGSSLSNSGSGQVFYTVSPNDSSFARSGNIGIAGQLFSISQSPLAPCAYSILPTSRAHNFASVTGAVSVTTQAGCPWIVSNSNAWVNILSSVSNSGSGQVIYSISSNTTSFARSANIGIAGQIFSISQSATPETNLMSLAEALDTVGTPLVWLAGGNLPWSGTTGVTHDGVDAAQSGGIGDGAASSFRTTINGPGTLTFWWKVSSETNNDTLRFFVGGFEQGRISGQVDWQQRTVTISAGSYNLEWVYAKNSTLAAGQDRGWVDQIQFVSGPACPVSLSATSASHGSGSSTGIVGIVASGCAWSVANTNPWISIVSAASTNEAGSGTLVYTVDANSSASVRSGNIRIEAENFLVTQSGTNPPACTISILPGSRTHGYGAATNTVTVTTQAGCAWSVVTTNSWINILSSLNNSSSGTVVYSLAPNTNAQSRAGNVMIGAQQFHLTQAGVSLSETNALRLQFMSLSGIGATLSVQGEAGKMYVVECSEDLIDWRPISTNSAPSTVTDAAVGNAPHRFYRTVEIP